MADKDALELLRGLSKAVAQVAAHFEKPITDENVVYWLALNSAQAAAHTFLRAEEAKKAEGQVPAMATSGAQGEGAVSRTTSGEPLSPQTAVASPASSAPVSSEKVQPMSLRDQLFHDLAGVIADVEDEVCRTTLRNIQQRLDSALYEAQSATPAITEAMVDKLADNFWPDDWRETDVAARIRSECKDTLVEVLALASGNQGAAIDGSSKK